MPAKGCPHCGNRVSDDAARCPCGFAFRSRGPEIRGPKAAREVSRRWSDRLRKKVKPARKAEPSRPAAPTPRRQRKRSPTVASPAAGGLSPEGDLPGTRESLLTKCPGCLARISKRAERCPKCGETPFSPCQICGERILTGSAECPECGDPQPFGA